jgi:hypothetical protein
MGNVLLASATSEELAAGKMSEARVNEVMQKAGRWMDVSGQGSIAGGSSIGRTFTQFKKWAIPPTLTIGEDLVSLGKTIGTLGKTRMTAQQVQETLKLGAMGVIAVYTGSVLHKDEENDSFKGQTIHYLRRVVGSMWRGLDPAFFLGAAGPAYIVKLGMDLHLLGTLEEYKKGPHEGENKGKIALERDLIPRFVKDVMRAVEPEEQESEKDKSPSQF